MQKCLKADWNLTYYLYLCSIFSTKIRDSNTNYIFFCLMTLIMIALRRGGGTISPLSALRAQDWEGLGRHLQVIPPFHHLLARAQLLIHHPPFLPFSTQILYIK